jgi:hypothetical protein
MEGIDWGRQNLDGARAKAPWGGGELTGSETGEAQGEKDGSARASRLL